MKTEQEQIEEMARSTCGYCSTDGKCAVSKNGREPDICANVDTQHCLYKEYAERLIESGYGDVTEYKAEIERLRQEVRDTDKMARNSIEQYRAENKELENALKQSEDNYSRAFERLKAQQREIEQLKDEIIYLERKIAIRDNALKDRDKAIEMLEGKQDTIVKQAKIDILNEVKARCSETFVGKRIISAADIDKIIEEVENEQKD